MDVTAGNLERSSIAPELAFTLAAAAARGAVRTHERPSSRAAMLLDRLLHAAREYAMEIGAHPNPARRLAMSERRPVAAVRLRVDPDGRSFALGAAPRVDLSRRGPTRRVLCALVEQRLRAPGVGLSTDKLVEHGWPGQRMLTESGHVRVRSIVRTLRDLGLRGAIVTQDDGYLLSPHIEISPSTIGSSRRACAQDPESDAG